MSVKLKHLALLFLFVSCFAQSAEKLCGWLDNPTPANHTLTDAKGTWIISTQGGESVDDQSFDKMPLLNENEFVHTNGSSYGYSCACLNVAVDKRKKRVLKIYGGKQLLLKKCLEDPLLASKKP
jgi:Protein of unknown function (DUF4087)